MKAQSLIGKFFFSFPEKEDGSRPLSWQGQVISRPLPGVYLVQINEWLFGTPSDQMVVPLQQMVDEQWTFYDDHDDWVKAGERHLRRDEAVEREREHRERFGSGEGAVVRMQTVRGSEVEEGEAA